MNDEGYRDSATAGDGSAIATRQRQAVQVPMSTARQITEAREHLTVAAKTLVTAARVVKPYSPDSSVIALHIEQQVSALAERLEKLLDGLEVVR